MVNEKYHEVPLRWGKTDGTNLPHMPKNKYFCAGYNPKYGLVDVCEGNGRPVLEGRINIEKLLSKIQPNDQEKVDSQVETFLMEAYDNNMANQNNPKEPSNPSKPYLEILTYAA